VAIQGGSGGAPDVDRIYMTYVQASTGGGGWPMSVLADTGAAAVFRRTYFPPENRWGHRVSPPILTQIAEAWANDRGKIQESARQVVEQLTRQ